MNTISISRPTTTPQPKRITSTAWAWGFEDGAQGKSVYLGYHLFCGAKLAEYKRGWHEGHNLTTDAYVPFQMPKEAYSDAQPDYMREDWVGE